MKCEIDIDLGPLADEWGPVAFRRAITGDVFVKNNDVTYESTADAPQDGPRLIVRRRWKWPEWLTAEWIAMDQGGEWWAYSHEPEARSDYWNCVDGECDQIIEWMTKWDAPPCTDWTQSKRRNPNAKATK